MKNGKNEKMKKERKNGKTEGNPSLLSALPGVAVFLDFEKFRPWRRVAWCCRLLHGSSRVCAPIAAQEQVTCRLHGSGAERTESALKQPRTRRKQPYSSHTQK